MIKNYLISISIKKAKCYDKTNKSVLVKMKDETNGIPITEFFGLK